MFEPRRVLISRRERGTGDTMEHVPGLMTAPPQLGEPLQMFLETGKIMRTTAVISVGHDGKELVIDTRNSRYRLTPAS